MIVLVESNFVLELAFRQRDVADAERLMDLAAQGRIRLAIPGCALFEPFETLIRRRKERRDILRDFRREVLQLSRSQHFSDLSDTSEAVSGDIRQERGDGGRRTGQRHLPHSRMR